MKCGSSILFDRHLCLNHNTAIHDAEVGNPARWWLLPSLKLKTTFMIINRTPLCLGCVLVLCRGAPNRSERKQVVQNQLCAYRHLLHWTAYYICKHTRARKGITTVKAEGRAEQSSSGMVQSNHAKCEKELKHTLRENQPLSIPDSLIIEELSIVFFLKRIKKKPKMTLLLLFLISSFFYLDLWENVMASPNFEGLGKTIKLSTEVIFC